MSGPEVRVTYHFEDINNIADGIITGLEEGEVDLGQGIVALALCIGRLMNPSPQERSDEAEAAFVQALLEWAGMYYTKGAAN